MNKLNILILGLVVFAAVAMGAHTGEELVSEIDEDVEVSPELEGGFMDSWKTHDSKARFAIKHGSESQYGEDIQLRGQTKLVDDRTSRCSHAKSKPECENCCRTDEAGANGVFTSRVAHLTNKIPGVPKRETCVCFSKSADYISPGLAR